jgi:charged multivesicular body protein 7
VIKTKSLVLQRYSTHSFYSLRQVIKFHDSKQAASITKSDVAVAQLKSTQLSLTEQIDLLISQCDAFTQKARDAASKKSRIVALSALKSRKLTESALQKRVDALAQIEEVLNGVEQAASDVEILRTLEGGAKTLERLNKDIGGIERVEKVMDQVREGIEVSEDVGRIIAEMGSSKVDESEVQEEFDEMLKAEQERERLEKERVEKERLEKERLERERHEQLEREQQEMAKKKIGLEDKATEEEIKEDRLLSELKSVSLESPEEVAEMI